MSISERAIKYVISSLGSGAGDIYMAGYQDNDDLLVSVFNYVSARVKKMGNRFEIRSFNSLSGQ